MSKGFGGKGGGKKVWVAEQVTKDLEDIPEEIDAGPSTHLDHDGQFPHGIRDEDNDKELGELAQVQLGTWASIASLRQK